MNIKFVKVFLRGCFLKKTDLWNSLIYVRKQKLTGKCHLCDVIPIILKWVIWSNFDWDVLGFLRKTHLILSCPRHRQQLDCRDDEGIEQFINDIKVGKSRHLCDPIGLNEIYRLMALDQRKWPKMYGCIFPYSHVNLSQAFISVYFRIKMHIWNFIWKRWIVKHQTFRSQWTLSIDDWIEEHCYVYERNIDYKNGFGKWQNNSSEHHHPWNKLKNGPISTETFFIFILTTVLPAFRSYFSFKVTLQYLQDKLICNGILRDDKGVVHEWNPLQSL